MTKSTINAPIYNCKKLSEIIFMYTINVSHQLERSITNIRYAVAILIAIY